uniref:ATP synthase complex subunit 8 n=1 Tax=Mesalina olivieri TaxID=162270 RepID=A0A8A3WNF8_9SAUR|nr:ATP synthase F0 subunit 8 [Mesalina olivieri]QTA72568.1 ATP synthase F0 subunit 8 [Mesalina olivieri]
MPQLNPAPWFLIFMLIWLMLFILLTKVLKTPTNSSPLQPTHKPNNYFWTWPWP